ncbi:MAG: outer membrane lipoprotein carrier protein LolA [Phycisphaerales bacterium]|nr:outer membrane lipoprotein carrier protein LolA [Phycisphaerales bacterium]
MTRRRCVGLWAALMMPVAAGFAFGSATPTLEASNAAIADSTPASKLASQAELLNVLHALQDRGTTLKDFSANLRVRVHHLRTDETDINIGKIWYQRQGSTSRFDIHFDILAVDGAIARKHADHDLVFDGRWFIDRDGAAKIFRKTEVAPPGSVVNPLKLGQGPLPIPIGQDPHEVLKDFHAQLLLNANGMEHLILKPRDKKVFDFDKLQFWIDPKLGIPVKIRRTDPDGTPTTATFTNIKINTGKAHDFHVHVPAPGSGWTVILQPWKSQ